jgi:hypothetical protein
MVSSFLQARFRVEKLFLSDIRIFLESPECSAINVWISPEILLKHDTKEISAYVVMENKLRKEIEADNQAKRDFESKAEMVIQSYFKLCSLITKSVPQATLEASHSLESKDRAGKYVTSKEMRFLYDLLPTDADKKEVTSQLRNFLNDTKRIYNKYLPVIDKFPFLKIATDFFYKSKLNFDYTNGQFMEAVISLEALFNEDPSDVIYKIRLRTAFILGLVGYRSIDVSNDLKDIYSKRNSLFHGKKDVKINLHDVGIIQEYVRKSIVSFCILCNNRLGQDSQIKKEGLLNEIDDAIIDASKSDEMRKELVEGIKDFQLNIPEEIGVNNKRRW